MHDVRGTKSDAKKSSEWNPTDYQETTDSRGIGQTCVKSHHGPPTASRCRDSNGWPFLMDCVTVMRLVESPPSGKYRQRPSDAVRQANHEWKEECTLGQGNRSSVAAYVEAVSGWQETVTTNKGTWYHVRVKAYSKWPSRVLK